MRHIAQRSAGQTLAAALLPVPGNPYFLLRSQAIGFSVGRQSAIRYRYPSVVLPEFVGDAMEPKEPRYNVEPEARAGQPVHPLPPPAAALIPTAGKRATQPFVQKEGEILPVRQQPALERIPAPAPIRMSAPWDPVTAILPTPAAGDARVPPAPIGTEWVLPVRREAAGPAVPRVATPKDSLPTLLQPVAPATNAIGREGNPRSVGWLQPPPSDQEGKEKSARVLRPITPVPPTPKIQPRPPPPPRLVIGKLIVEVVPPPPPVIKEKRRTNPTQATELGKEWANKLIFGLG